jgi:4-aminobutyrate aminotransferase-like enzyme
VEREGLVERSAVLGKRLLDGLQRLYELPAVGEVRGLGLAAGVELAQDRESRTLFDPKREIAHKVLGLARENGLHTLGMGDRISIAPPFVTPEETIDRIPEILYDAIAEITGR